MVVLGGGPAGVRAAEEAAARGQRVAIIDPKGRITGTPSGSHSKCLREAAMAGAESWSQVKAIVDRCVTRAEEVTSSALRMFHIEVMKGTGQIVDNAKLSFHPQEGTVRDLTFDVLMIATGSKSNRFPPVDFNMPGVYDSDTIQGISRIPESMVVQGAGIIGLEYAGIFARLGTKNITVVDNFDQIVPMLELELREACLKVLTDLGIKIHLSTPIKGIAELPGSTTEHPLLQVDLGEAVGLVDCDCLLSACGRHGNHAGIGLEALTSMGLKLGPAKMIQTDADGWTGVKRVFAVGDVTGASFASMAQAQAERAVRCCWGSGYVKKETLKACKPSAVWTIPEIAWAGDTEEKAQASGVNVGAAVAHYHQTVRGCVSDKEGFLKLVFDQDTGRVLGVHIFGEQSSDLVNFGAMIINDGNSIFEVLQFVFPAVTYHELYHLAAAEAKLRFRLLRGMDSMCAAAAWGRARECLRKSLPEGEDISSSVDRMFMYYDEDNSGFLSSEQLRMVMHDFGVELSQEELRDMLADAKSQGGAVCDGVDRGYFMNALKP